MSDLFAMLQAAAGAGGEEVDPNFNQTVLLLHGDGTNGAQNNTFVDSSTNNFTVTRNGNTTQGSFSPFGRTSGNLDDVYDPAVNGGSGYFDGTGDYLSVAYNAALEIGASSFCIEGWIYLNALPASSASSTILGKWGASVSYIFQVFNDSGTIKLAFAYSTNGGSVAGQVNEAAAVTTNTWHHVAVTRDSTTLRIFLDGVQQGSNQTVSATFYNGSSSINIGRNEAGNINFINGYVSNVRLVIGSAVYTSGFTPSGPLTNITNTALLLNFTNAGIFDNTGKNNLETVGNAQIDTTTKKYGTGSMEFDGTGDYLLAPTSSNDLFNFGTGNFTVEMWFYANSLSASDYAGLCGCHNTGFASSWNAYVRSNGIFFYGANATLTGAGTISTGTWYHFAAVRNGNTLTVYLDGVSVDSDDVTGDSYTNSDVGFRVGDDPNVSNPAFNGFIDDLRITKGVARYTANFTPPTQAFPNL